MKCSDAQDKGRKSRARYQNTVLRSVRRVVTEKRQLKKLFFRRRMAPQLLAKEMFGGSQFLTFLNQ